MLRRALSKVTTRCGSYAACTIHVRSWTSSPSTDRNGMPSIVPPRTPANAAGRRPPQPIASSNNNTSAPTKKKYVDDLPEQPLSAELKQESEAAAASMIHDDEPLPDQQQQQSDGDAAPPSQSAPPLVVPASSARRVSRHAPSSSIDAPSLSDITETSSSTGLRVGNWQQMVPQAYSHGTADELMAAQRPSIPSSYGHLNLTISGVRYEGSIMVLPNFVLSWAPTKWSEVTPESLSFLELILPRPDLLLFGTGTETMHPSPAVRQYLESLEIGFEVSSTPDALGTFAILHEEDRRVAAAIIAIPVKESVVQPSAAATTASSHPAANVTTKAGGHAPSSSFDRDSAVAAARRYMELNHINTSVIGKSDGNGTNDGSDGELEFSARKVKSVPPPPR